MYRDARAAFLNLLQPFCTTKQATRKNVVTLRAGRVLTPRSQQVTSHFLETPVLLKMLFTGSQTAGPAPAARHCAAQKNPVTE